jgi:hypothetical protein
MSFYNDNNDENIRLPDEVKRETLIYDNNNNYNNNYDKELEDALYQSIQLYENEIQKNEEFEQKIINQHSEQIKNRREILKPILFELNRIKNYDNKICKILEIIDPILDLYCGLVIEKYVMDNKTYDYIFNGLKKIRIDIDFLKSIIVCE